MQESSQFTKEIQQVTSQDGTPIGYRQMGSGPGMLVLHGGGRASQHYLGLARALAGQFTVYIPDRRGRGQSGPEGPEYGLTKAIEDLGALVEETGARLLFGHSGGGLIALEAAKVMSFDSLLLYEPAISIDGSLPLNWYPRFERALQNDDPASAMAYFLKGLQMNWMSSLPVWLLTPFFNSMLRGHERQEILQLLHTLPAEMGMLRSVEGHYLDYSCIQARTLLMCGVKSPAFLRIPLQRLAEVIPQATLIELPGLDHSSPEEDGANLIAEKVKWFLEATLPPIDVCP